jgi:hypothetical protein
MAKLLRFEVTVERTETTEYKHIVLAYTEEQAERVALNGGYEGRTTGPRFVDEDEEGEYMDGDSEVKDVTLIELNGDHYVSPIGRGDITTCALCGEPVRWTGTDRTETTPLIPGPWVHTNAPEVK